jgi:hypothetical protein
MWIFGIGNPFAERPVTPNARFGFPNLPPNLIIFSQWPKGREFIWRKSAGYRHTVGLAVSLTARKKNAACWFAVRAIDSFVKSSRNQ